MTDSVPARVNMKHLQGLGRNSVLSCIALISLYTYIKSGSCLLISHARDNNQESSRSAL